jgi:hypothetical protein
VVTAAGDQAITSLVALTSPVNVGATVFFSENLAAGLARADQTLLLCGAASLPSAID